MPFIISVIGSRTVAGGGDTTGFQQIRAAQIEFAAGRPNVFIGFTAAKTFVARNLMWDGVHYSARGYDEMGRALASVAAVACAGRA
jgi:lysophospholipase L1-like esterase